MSVGEGDGCCGAYASGGSACDDCCGWCIVRSVEFKGGEGAEGG